MLPWPKNEDRPADSRYKLDLQSDMTSHYSPIPAHHDFHDDDSITAASQRRRYSASHAPSAELVRA
jgi:hypothetical protein